jgi:signal transduction histidine kinase
MKQPSLLVIDDEPDNFDVIEALLSRQDYQLHYAPSGAAAISSLDAFQPDLILLDVMMPDMDGIEVCRKIKALPPWQYVPIIMVTALSGRSDLAHCLIAGADDFISKPVNGMELLARVQSMLRIKRQYDQIQGLSQSQAGTITYLEKTLTGLRGNLANTLAHELNTPLNGILGPLILLKNHFDDMDKESILKMVEIVERSARRLEDLTQKSLLYLELELAINDQKSIDTTPTQLIDLTLQTDLKIHAHRYDRRGDLTFEIGAAKVPLAERYVSILFRELVDNALKFSSAGTKIAVQSQLVNHHLSIAVADQGQGMTPEQIAKVGAFTQFGSLTYQRQGMGIGLKLVKNIAALAGGQVAIQSRYQQATTVTVTLPVILP